MGYFSFLDIMSHVILIVILCLSWCDCAPDIWKPPQRLERDGKPNERTPWCAEYLKERYAKGEISTEEYEEKKKVLMQ